MNWYKIGVKTGGILLAICLMACTSATVTEPSACDSQSISFAVPAVPPIPMQYVNAVNCGQYSVSVPNVSTTTQVDMSDMLKKIRDVAGGIDVSISSLSIDNSNGELSWISGATIQVSTSNLPIETLATYTAPSTGVGSEINPIVVLPATDILIYFSDGPITFTITLEGQNVTACQALSLQMLASSGSLESNFDLCISVSGTFNKSL